MVEVSARSWLQSWADRFLRIGLSLSALGITTSVPIVYVGFFTTFLGAMLVPSRLAQFGAGWPWAVAFSLWTILVGLLSPFETARILPGFAYCWPAMVVWAFAASDQRRMLFAWWALIVGALLAVILAAIQYGVGYRIDLRPLRVDPAGIRGQQASGFYSHWIRFGDAMACATLWLVVWLQDIGQVKRRHWIVTVLVGVIGTWATFISGARGAFLALLGGAWLLALGLVPRRRLAFVAIGLVAVAGIAVACSPSSYRERVSNALAGQDGRTYIWHTAWETFRQRPWLGIGDGAFNQAASATVAAGLSPAGPEGPDMGNAHNSFLSLLVLYGVPGLALWSGWLFTVVRHLWRHRGDHPAVWPLTLATLGVFLIGGLTEDLAAYASSRFQLFFGLAIALGLSAQATDAERSGAA